MSELTQHIKIHKKLGLSANIGQKVVTVGAKGDYPLSSMQAAIDSILALEQFTLDTIIPVTGTSVGVTNGSTTVIGIGTNFNSIRSRWFTVTPNAPRKWYSVKRVISATELILDVPYSQATDAAVAIADVNIGRPNMHKLVILDDHDEQVRVPQLGGFVPAEEVAIEIIWQGEQNGNVTVDFISGLCVINGLNAPWHTATNFFKATDATSAAKYHFKNVDRRTSKSGDFIPPTTNKRVGEFILEDSHIEGNFDVFMPQAKHVLVRNSTIKSVAQDLSHTTSKSHPFLNLTHGNGDFAEFRHSDIIAGGIGDLITSTPCLISEEDHSDLTILFDHVNFIIDATDKGTGILIVDLSFISIGSVTDSTIILRQCTFSFLGNPIPPAGWRFLQVQVGATGNTIIFEDTPTFDLPNNINEAINIKYIGSTSREKAVSQTAGTLLAAELDYLRADTFDVTVDGNTDVPAVANAPKGNSIKFIFEQSGAGGFAVTWNAAYNFVNAWSNAGNTTGKKAVVEFMSDGAGNWIQTSTQNTYF